MKKIGIGLLVLFCFGLISCFSREPVDQAAAEEYVKNLTEEEIVKKNSSSKLSYSKSTIGNKVKLSVKRFNGVEETYVVKTNSAGKKIKVSSNVQQGAIRIVLCDSKKIVHEFEIGKDETFEIPSSSEKMILKTAGKDAAYSIVIEWESGINLENESPKDFQIVPKRKNDFETFSI